MNKSPSSYQKYTSKMLVNTDTVRIHSDLTLEMWSNTDITQEGWNVVITAAKKWWKENRQAISDFCEEHPVNNLTLVGLTLGVAHTGDTWSLTLAHREIDVLSIALDVDDTSEDILKIDLSYIDEHDVEVMKPEVSMNLLRHFVQELSNFLKVTVRVIANTEKDEVMPSYIAADNWQDDERDSDIKYLTVTPHE